MQLRAYVGHAEGASRIFSVTAGRPGKAIFQHFCAGTCSRRSKLTPLNWNCFSALVRLALSYRSFSKVAVVTDGRSLGKLACEAETGCLVDARGSLLYRPVLWTGVCWRTVRSSRY